MQSKEFTENRHPACIAKGKAQTGNSIQAQVGFFPDLFLALQTLAKENGKSFSWAVREAVAKGLEEMEMGKMIVFCEGAPPSASNAEILQKYFRKSTIVWNWDGASKLPPQALVFTSADVRGAITLREVCQQAGLE
jgi:hypothetical protein